MRLAAGAIVALAASVASGSEDFQLLRLDGHLVKWGGPDMGTPATVTYAFVAAHTRFPGARNCKEMVPLDGLLAQSGVAPATFVREAEAALAAWEEAAGISFRRIADPAAADLLIGAQAKPRRWAFADVSYAPSEGTGPRRIERSLICLNPARPWKVGRGGREGAYDLRYVLTHEAGHAIGLDHAGREGQIMSFAYPERLHGLQPGDIDGAARLYGAAGPAARTASRPEGAETVQAALPAADRSSPTDRRRLIPAD